MEKAKLFISDFGHTAVSAIKLITAAGCPVIPRTASPGRSLVVLGNGPSLKDNIKNDMPLLTGAKQLPDGSLADTLAVNFAANAPEFNEIQPRYYLLADPHFFDNQDDANVSRLMQSLGSVSWPMMLFLPAGTRLPAILASNTNLKVCRFPFRAMEGFSSFEHIAFKRQWGMPRPRNVLIPSLMVGLWMGYTKIYILGADHSWLRTLSVDNDNRVVTIQPHFYADDRHEQQRVTSVYRDVRLHQVLESMCIAFRSYHTVERFARSIGAEIVNATPGSFIDAFRRAPFSDTHR